MMTLSIPEMSCGHCKAAVENAVTRLDAQAVIRVDLPARRAEIETDQPPSSLIAALLAAGFAAEPV
ncbi:MAG: heavy-metal-associated domain-containing protein [Pseudorhodobacter sp.]